MLAVKKRWDVLGFLGMQGWGAEVNCSWLKHDLELCIWVILLCVQTLGNVIMTIAKANFLRIDSSAMWLWHYPLSFAEPCNHIYIYTHCRWCPSLWNLKLETVLSSTVSRANIYKNYMMWEKNWKKVKQNMGPIGIELVASWSAVEGFTTEGWILARVVAFKK